MCIRDRFYTLLAIGTLIFDKAPFENCIVLGHVQDKDGQKMSKHKGNVVDPWSVLDRQGADAVRWYFYSASAPWLPSRFYDEAVSEMQRKFMGKMCIRDSHFPEHHCVVALLIALLDEYHHRALHEVTDDLDFLTGLLCRIFDEAAAGAQSGFHRGDYADFFTQSYRFARHCFVDFYNRDVDQLFEILCDLAY